MYEHVHRLLCSVRSSAESFLAIRRTAFVEDYRLGTDVHSASSDVVPEVFRRPSVGIVPVLVSPRLSFYTCEVRNFRRLVSIQFVVDQSSQMPVGATLLSHGDEGAISDTH